MCTATDRAELGGGAPECCCSAMRWEDSMDGRDSTCSGVLPVMRTVCRGGGGGCMRGSAPCAATGLLWPGVYVGIRRACHILIRCGTGRDRDLIYMAELPAAMCMLCIHKP